MTYQNSIPGQSFPRSTAATGRVRGELDLFDVIALAWSEKGFIALVFAVLFAAGVAASLTLLKPTYTADLQLMINLEDNPVPTTAGLGGAFMVPQIMQSERELLNSDAVKRRALSVIGPAAVLDGPLTGDVEAAALKSMRGSFSVSRAPNSSVLTASYETGNAERSAFVLNAIVDAYLVFREDVLIERGFAGLVDRRNQADARVLATQGALDGFLLQNNLANYTADKTAAETSVSTLTDRLRTARADRDAAAGGAEAIRSRLLSVPAQIELYAENGITGVSLDLLAERERLLSRYQETAPAVVAIDREIAAIQAFIATGEAQGMGQVRTGVNPIRQTMETDLAGREANVLTETRRVATLETQLRTARGEVTRLRGLEPQFIQLQQAATGATEASAIIATQEAAAASRRSSATGTADSIRVFDRASVPTEAKSMKKLGLIGSFVFAAGVAMFLGLIRGYWRGYVGARALAAPQRQPGHYPHPQYPEAATTQPPHVANDALSDLPVLARVSDRIS
jgi:uncharacterized protein involved in exopolysaccharide biosynthesis